MYQNSQVSTFYNSSYHTQNLSRPKFNAHDRRRKLVPNDFLQD